MDRSRRPTALVCAARRCCPLCLIQYSDYAAWREAALRQPEVRGDLGYLARKLEARPICWICLPITRVRPISLSRGSQTLRDRAGAERVASQSRSAAAGQPLQRFRGGFVHAALPLFRARRHCPWASVFGARSARVAMGFRIPPLYTRTQDGALGRYVVRRTPRGVQKATLDLYAHRSPLSTQSCKSRDPVGAPAILRCSK